MFQALPASVKNTTSLQQPLADVFIPAPINIRQELLQIRQRYLDADPDALITLDHIKSNYDNHYVTNSIKGQTKDLSAVSTEDFCNLSEILENIRTPKDMVVYRAMEANDFNIGRMLPEEFFEEYYKEGKIVTVPQYMSTSLDKNIAYRFSKNNPHRFVIKLKVPEKTPAVYMEELTPGDPYGAEDELLITKNAMIKLGKIVKSINPLNNSPVYEIEGTIVGHRFIKPEPKPVHNFEADSEFQEFINALKNK